MGIRNAQNCGKTNHGFYIMVTLVREFLTKNKTVNMAQPPYSADLSPNDFFLFKKLKTPTKGKRFVAIEKIKKIETGAVGDTKKCAFRSVSRIGKNASIRVLYLRGVTLKGFR